MYVCQELLTDRRCITYQIHAYGKDAVAAMCARKAAHLSHSGTKLGCESWYERDHVQITAEMHHASCIMHPDDEMCSSAADWTSMLLTLLIANNKEWLMLLMPYGGVWGPVRWEVVSWLDTFDSFNPNTECTISLTRHVSYFHDQTCVLFPRPPCAYVYMPTPAKDLVAAPH